MPRGAKTIANVTGHRTKAEIAQRQKAEGEILTGKKCFERDGVKNDPVAHGEFKRVVSLLKKINQDDALYGAAVNRYCELYSEAEQLKIGVCSLRVIINKAALQIGELEDTGTLEEIEKAEDLLKMLTTALGQLASLDKNITAKRKMMADIEKENGWTVLSALRAVPKTSKENDIDPLMSILGGGST